MKYVELMHACTSYNSWGKIFWKCRCGESGFCDTETGAQRTIGRHQKDMEKECRPIIAALRKTKYIRRLFT